ncbi:MAG TPA: hypothetical protein VJ870_20030 [Amycolatopsis sp.]|nr:hypothetical protein [Amycolatopsis sp.]
MAEHDISVGHCRPSVHQRLDNLTRSADVADDDQAADLARREIPLLVQALRSVLATHEPDARGRCPLCREHRSRPLFRRGRLPCRIYLAVQLRLGTLESAIPRCPHRHRAHLRPVG